MGFVHAGETIRCRHGHRIIETGHTRVGSLRCGGRHSAGRCGALVYVVEMRAENRTWRFAADMSEAELDTWRSHGFTADQALEWLGALLPAPKERHE